MKILFVSPFFDTHGGGVEIVVENLARRLASRGHEVSWAASGFAGETVPVRHDVRIVPMAGFDFTERRFGFPYPIWSPSALRELRREAVAAEVVNVHEALYVASQLAERFALRAGRPVVLTQHVGSIPYRNPILRLAMAAGNLVLTRRALRRAGAVVFISEAVRRQLSRGLPPGHVETIFNGVDTEMFRPSREPREAIRSRLGLAPDRPAMLFVGRFVERKGLASIREAARSLPGADWVLLGRGTLDPRRWGLPNVRVVGQLPQESLASWYQAADALVLPSVGEGFPLVVQEAMACGTPCVVSDEILAACPPAAEYLSSAGSSSEDLVEACRRLLAAPPRDEARRAEIGAWSARQWSWAGCVERYERVFRRASGGAAQ